MKPNVMRLAVFTGAVGLLLAPGEIHPVLVLTTILCMAAGAGGCGAINNWFDSDIDQGMTRTRLRPTAAGRIAPAEALGFGTTLSVLSVMWLGLSTNWLAASLLALTIAYYVLIYTVWLKRRTPQNIVIGGAAGALPPMIGWSAVTGSLSATPILMFLLVFLWTPPHFWALALWRAREYGRVGVPMMPVVEGRKRTQRAIVAYSVAVAVTAVVLGLVAGLGWIYLLVSAALSLHFVWLAVRVLRQDSDVMAMRTFRFSIIYLFVLFAAMVVDHAFAGAIRLGVSL